MKLYAGNLPYSVTEDDLRNMFSSYGNVDSVRIIMDRISGKPKGFGFVDMPNDSEAQEAINSLNGSDVQGRAIIVNEAQPPKRDGGSRGGDRGGDRRPSFGNRNNRW